HARAVVVGGVLPCRADARPVAGDRRTAAAQARDRSVAAAADGRGSARCPAARRRAPRLRVHRLLRSAGAHATPAVAVTERYFAPCPRGLEEALATELGALGAHSVLTAEGGVGFAGSLELAYRANLESRLASRILWQVAHGRYRNEDELYRLANGV